LTKFSLTILQLNFLGIFSSPSLPVILDALHARTEHPQFRERLDIARTWIHSSDAHPNDVRMRLGNGIAAAESCVAALYIALRFLDAPFGEMLHYVARCRGDVDTIGAMAGAIWGARNGESGLPLDALAKLEDADRIRGVALALHAVHLETIAA
jgi:poly(ADP-ribose) glycohydrolase ARH3